MQALFVTLMIAVAAAIAAYSGYLVYRLLRGPGLTAATPRAFSMPFQIPSDLHADVMPIAFLLGHWQGNGHGDYPTIEKFEFRQEVGFTHDGRPFLHYLSRTWLIDGDGNDVRPLALETGFFRPKPTGLEVVLAHPTGYAEVYYGQVDGAKIELTTDAVVRTATAKEYTAGHRLYGLVEGDLLWTYDMAAMGQPLQPHIWARLKRTE